MKVRVDRLVFRSIVQDLRRDNMGLVVVMGLRLIVVRPKIGLNGSNRGTRAIGGDGVGDALVKNVTYVDQPRFGRGPALSAWVAPQ